MSKFEKSTNNIQVRFYFKIGIYLVLVSWILDFWLKNKEPWSEQKKNQEPRSKYEPGAKLQHQ